MKEHAEEEPFHAWAVVIKARLTFRKAVAVVTMACLRVYSSLESIRLLRYAHLWETGFVAR